MPVHMIAGIDPNRVIGKDGWLPRHYKADLKFFKRTTTDCPIVMGRWTYQSIGRPLPKRTNIILSTSLTAADCPWCTVYTSIADILTRYREDYKGDKPLMIIGWATLYEQFLDIADKLILTKIPEVVSDADTWFPRYDTEYVCTHCELIDEKHGLVVEEWSALE